MRTLSLLAFTVWFSSAVPAAQHPDVVWSTENVGQPFTSEQPNAILAEPDGGAWVAVLMIPDSYLARYDETGQEVWRTWLTDARANGVCADGTGGVFVVGSTSGSGFAPPPIGLEDAFLARVDSTGTLSWARRMGSTSIDSAADVVPDGAGGAIVVGRTLGGSFGGPPIGDQDSFVARYDATGAEQWVTRIGLGGHLVWLGSVERTASGAIFSAGSADQPCCNPTGAVVRLDGGGNVAWLRVNYSPISFLTGIGDDGNDGFFAAGIVPTGTFAWVMRGSPGGDVLWSRSVFEQTDVQDCASLPGGDYLVGGRANDSAFLKRFDSAGNGVEELTLEPSTPGVLTAVGVDGRGSAFVSGVLVVAQFVTATFVGRVAVDPIGTPQCPGQPNSTGLGATVQAVGSILRADDAVTIYAGQLPPNVFGYFLASPTQGFVAGPGGSQGNLCLASPIGRFTRPGEIFNSGAGGRFHLFLDLDDVPTPSASTSVLAGQPWYFQAWYRDLNPTATSNFTGSVEVVTQ